MTLSRDVSCVCATFSAMERTRVGDRADRSDGATRAVVVVVAASARITRIIVVVVAGAFYEGGWRVREAICHDDGDGPRGCHDEELL